MIYITGDVHIPTADIQKLNTKRFPEQKQMSGNDYVIICGDFGGIWNNSNEEKYWVKWLNNKRFTTLFIDGNHENFDLLNEYEVVTYCGGTAHKIADKVYHLMRGQVFSLDGKKIFTLGGASSHDKEHRKDGKSWWSAEMPSSAEYELARENLAKCGNSVDVIISHCAPSSIQNQIAPQYEVNELTEFLEYIKNHISYEKWFFGHYHVDCEIDRKHSAVFQKIIEIRTKGDVPYLSTFCWIVKER